MLAFQDYRIFGHNNSEAEAKRSYTQAALSYKTKREHARNSSGPMSQAYCKRKPLNLEKTTSSVLSNLWVHFEIHETQLNLAHSNRRCICRLVFFHVQFNSVIYTFFL